MTNATDNDKITNTNEIDRENDNNDNGHEIKRRVSISKDAIQADNDKLKRNSLNSDKFKTYALNSVLSPTQSPPTSYPTQNNQFIRANSIGKGRRNSITSNTSSSQHARKHSISTYRSNRENDDDSNSWWYMLCLKCRQKEVGPGWEPFFWSKLCPHPFCPSYRHVARIFALIIIGLLIWSFIYCLMGEEAAPGGQLFNIAVLCLTAHFIGWIFRIVTLPALLGMLIVGITFQNVGLIEIQGNYRTVSSVLRKISLVVILTRAGLDMDPDAMKTLYIRVITLGLLPWATEAMLMVILTHFILGLPWLWAFLLGCILAAVAPAVVVPCLFRLRNKGYGVAKGIPTLIIAVAGLDDALSVAFFGLFHSIMFSHRSLTYDLFMGPVSIIGGVAFGVIWGFIAKYVPEKEDPFVVPLRALMLFCGGLVAVFGSEILGFEGAGPLAVISAAFISVSYWSKQGWSVDDNPVATTFEIIWMLCEPILFSLTGTLVVLNQLESNTILYGCSFIVICFLMRIIVTIIVASGSSLNFKEKLFCSLSWMAKASVQAVLAPAALESVRKSGRVEELHEAEVLLTICILSMLITVPIGSISISASGTRLLTKVKNNIPSHGWRRSARPSLRDISIIDEEQEISGDDETGAAASSDFPKSTNDIKTETAHDNYGFTHM